MAMANEVLRGTESSITCTTRTCQHRFIYCAADNLDLLEDISDGK